MFMKITQRSPPEGSVSCVELGKSKMEMQDYTLANVQGVWPLVRSQQQTSSLLQILLNLDRAVKLQFFCFQG